MKLADRMARLGTETAFEVLARARQLEAEGREIVHLEIGEPDFDTPSNIVEAGVQALRNGATHYGPAAGSDDLKVAVAKDASQRRNLQFKPQQVVVCPGAKPILFYSILALINSGDEVIYPNPGFPIYESMIDFVGGRSVPLPLLEEKDFSFEVSDLEALITPKTRMVILNSPHNPTGGVLGPDVLEGIAHLAKKHDLVVLSDEIYSRILYDGQAHSITQIDGMMDRTIILDGFSKTYAMTGWRLGYGILPENLAPSFSKLQINAVSCTASFTQQAGVEALMGDQTEVEGMTREFHERRDLLVAGLNDIPGISCRTPAGAFYVFPNVRALGMESQKLASYLLEKGGVACLSGTAFGAHGEGHLRFSYANSKENLQKALQWIRAAVERIPSGSPS